MLLWTQASSTAPLGLAACASSGGGGADISMLTQLLQKALTSAAPELCTLPFAAYSGAAALAQERLGSGPLYDAACAQADAALHTVVETTASEVPSFANFLLLPACVPGGKTGKTLVSLQFQHLPEQGRAYHAFAVRASRANNLCPSSHTQHDLNTLHVGY